MTSSREELRYAGGVEASLGKTKSRSQTGTTSTNNNRIIFVVLQGISDMCKTSIAE
jgi:hypothetical protein